jgi:CheY-like chemotaxis protein
MLSCVKQTMKTQGEKEEGEKKRTEERTNKRTAGDAVFMGTDTCFCLALFFVLFVFFFLSFFLSFVRSAVMDGQAASREIRRLERLYHLPSVPIVALTANAFLEDRNKCAAAGMSLFVSKPFNKQNIISIVQLVCQQNGWTLASGGTGASRSAGNSPQTQVAPLMPGIKERNTTGSVAGIPIPYVARSSSSSLSTVSANSATSPPPDAGPHLAPESTLLLEETRDRDDSPPTGPHTEAQS